MSSKMNNILTDTLPFQAEETRLQHAGSEHRVGKGLVGAQELSVTFATDSIEEIPVYARLSNTSNHAEVCALIATLHHAADAAVFSSGMAAMTAFLFTFLKPGDHVLAQDNCYGGNQGLLLKILTRFGVDTTFAPISEWDSHVRENTRVCYFETISNPFCLPQDLFRAVQIAKANACLSICDNTFASPINCQPLEHGVDIVLESATKYLNGHSDLVCGALAGSSNLIKKINETAMYLGGFLSTSGCVTLMRGLRTLALRMQQHNENGIAFARKMRASSLVKEVNCGGLCASDDHRMKHFRGGFGGMVSVRFQPHVDVLQLLNHMTLVRNVPSLGGTETTACMPYYTTNRWTSESERQRLKIDTSLVRFSVGIENWADIVADVLETAARCARN